MAFRAINRFSSCCCSYRRPWRASFSADAASIVAIVLPSMWSFRELGSRASFCPRLERGSCGPKDQESPGLPGLPWVFGLSPEALKGRPLTVPMNHGPKSRWLLQGPFTLERVSQDKPGVSPGLCFLGPRASPEGAIRLSQGLTLGTATPLRRALTRRYSVAPSRKTPDAPGLEVLKGRQIARVNGTHQPYRNLSPLQGESSYSMVPRVETRL
jgi:hypothetical protein